MEKKKLNIGSWPKKSGLPSNIKEFVADRPEQKKSANKVNKWLIDLYKRGIIGGTAIGKHYSSLILDVTYQGSEIHIDIDGNISIGSEPVTNKNEFKTELEKYIEFIS